MKKLTLTLSLLLVTLASFGQDPEKVRITAKEVPAGVVQIINDYITTLQSSDSITAEKNVLKYMGGKLLKNSKTPMTSTRFNIDNDFKAAAELTTPIVIKRAAKSDNTTSGTGEMMMTGTEYRIHFAKAGATDDYLPYIHVMVPNDSSTVKEIRIVRCGQLDNFKKSKK